MYSRLRGYLYIILLMCISSSSFAITDEEKAYGGFATNAICSHPTILDYCVTEEQGGAKQACLLWLVNMQAGQSQNPNPIQWNFDSIVSDTCVYKGIQANTGYPNSTTRALETKEALCPTRDKPPPSQISFSRNGRWFPQELESTRCYKKCEYRVLPTTFTAKHYAFTNGVLTQFTENSNQRAGSNEKLCFNTVEPSRNSDGEIIEDSSCANNVFKVFCDFVNWYRNDSEMPEPPEVENKTLDIATHLKTDHVRIQSNANNQCFQPVEFDLNLPWANLQVKKEISFDQMCVAIMDFNGFLHVLYLLHAALIIFRK